MRPWDNMHFETAARRPAPQVIVEKFESRIGARLPADYREFLLILNGGRPIKPLGSQGGEYAVLSIDWQGRPPQQTDPEVIIDYLLAAESWGDVFTGEQNPALTLDGVYTDFAIVEPRIPVGMVPIGRDPGGSLLLIDVFGKQPGSVWFWAADWFDRNLLKSDPFHNVALLSPNFSSLIKNIVFKY